MDRRQFLKVATIGGIGALAGCGTKPIEIRDYAFEDILTSKRIVEGKVYVDNRKLPRYVEYVDKGSGGAPDGKLDEVRVYEKGTGWDLGKVRQLESIILTEDYDLTRLAVPREEWNVLMGGMVTNWDRYVLRTSQEGRGLQAEFNELRKLI